MEWALLGLQKTFATTVYVEATAPSGAEQDLALALKFLGADGSSCRACVVLTARAATLDASATSNPASTLWPAMPDYRFSRIAVTWSLPISGRTLTIAELESPEGFTPPNDGGLFPLPFGTDL